MESPLADREKYQASGRVGAEFVVLATPLAVVAALVAGGALFGLFWIGCYFSLVVPLLVVFPVAFAVVLAVRLGKCRNPAIAAVFGVFVGALTFGSYYYFDMLETRGADHLLRIDAVPDHIWLRLQTDRVQAHPGIRHQFAPRTPWGNYICFTIDGLLICTVTCVAAFIRAGRVYCERDDHWAECRILPLPAGSAQHVCRALAAGRLEDGLAVLRVMRLQLRQPYCELVLEVCSESPGSETCCRYLSLREIRGAARWLSTTHYSCFQKFLVRQTELTPDEFDGFRRKRMWDTPPESLEPRINARVSPRRWRMLAAAVALIVVGMFVIDLPGVVIRTQVKIVNGEADLPPQLVRLNNWCFVHWNPLCSISRWSGIGMLVVGALSLKVVASLAVADFARPPQTGDTGAGSR